MPDDSKLSARKSLKQIGMASPAAVKQAARVVPDTGGAFEARVVREARRLDLERTVAGQITGGG